MTKLPTNIAEVLGLLPASSTIHAIELEPQSKDVMILWENSTIESGLTVPVDYSVGKLKSKQLPKGVKEARKWAQELVKPVVEKKPQTETKTAVAANSVHYLTSEEYDAAIAAGKAVEYMGIKPQWEVVTPRTHKFTEGYFYRLVDKIDVIP